MTDTRFLNNKSVTCEANRVKYKTLIQDSWRIKAPNKKSVKGFAPAGLGLLFDKKWTFLPFWGRVPTPGHRLA